MANVLSLALKINADATGLQTNLGKAERAFLTLQGQAEAVSSVFDEFAGSSEAAARAQEETTAALNELLAGVQRGEVSAAEFARQFAAIGVAAREEADALREAARITEANLTGLERFTREQGRLKAQLDAGRISTETYTRAINGAAKGLSDAERAAAGLATQQQAIDDAAQSTTLKFNELSGVFSVLPGPLGNIAGRISGIASASEGLSRIFAGGLTQGFSSLVQSVTALINPFTLAVAGITAFAAAATAVARGLIDLENRVEALGNQAFQLGVSFEFVQVLDESARRSGTSVDALRGATTRLQQQLVEAGKGSEAAVAAFEGLGLSVEELESLDAQGQFEAIAKAISEIEDPAERTAAATKLLGEAGVQLLPFFRNLGPAADDVERLGRALTEVDERRIVEFGSALDGLGVATQGLGNALLVPFVGLGEGVANAFAEITAGITAIVDPIGRVLQPVLTSIGRIVEQLGRQLAVIGQVIGAVFEPFAVVVDEVYAALEPLYDLFGELQQTIQDSIVVAAEWLTTFSPIGVIAENAAALGDAISRVVTIIRTALARASEIVGALVSRFREFVAQSPLLQSIGEVISSVFGSVSSIFSTIAEAVGGVVGRLLDMAERFLGIQSAAEDAADGVRIIRDEVAGLSEEEQKAVDERQKFLDEFTASVSEAVEQSAQFGQAGFDAALQYQNAIADLQERLDRGLINETVFRREAEAARDAFDDQIEIAEQAADRIEKNTRRVDDLLAKANEIPKIEQEINAVQAEIDRVEAELAAARESGATAQADALSARLAQLDQLQAGLLDQQDEAAQGFERGFDAAFESVNSGVNSLIDKAAEFGDEGAIAAQQLADGIAAAQEQVRDGILNREAFEAEVQRQQDLYEQRLDQLEEEKRRRLKGEEEIAKERQRINQFVDDQLVQARLGGDSSRLAAFRNVQAIEAEIARVEAEVATARVTGDRAAVEFGKQRISQLKQIAEAERNIASGRKAVEEEIAKQRDKQIKEQAKQAEQALKEQAKQAEQAQARQQQELQKAFEAQTKERERLIERERELATPSSEAAQGNDIRTTEGANAFIQAIQGGFDPQYAVALQQLKVQREIAAGLAQNLRALNLPTLSFGPLGAA